MTYGGGGDGLVDNNNALSTMARALKMDFLTTRHEGVVLILILQ
jgi:hypothetical protein